MKELNLYKLQKTRITPMRHLYSLSVDVVEHCNLNCKYCDHFSPLADEKYTDIKVFTKDFEQLAKLTNGEIDWIDLMGGEPLLHPEINKFLEVSRKYFPKSNINIFTNAKLLLKQDDKFWLDCKKYNIGITYTKYPITLDYDLISEKIQKFKITSEIYGDTDRIPKTLHYLPLELDGKQDMNKNFMNCFQANKCIFLSNGKIYTCCVAGNIKHFNKYFNKNIPISDNDYINIYKVKSIKEILEFLCKPIPLCKYCNVEGRTYEHKWKRSKKEITEWT